jgi:ADP-heptose:LPS heptosyltransferase
MENHVVPLDRCVVDERQRLGEPLPGRVAILRALQLGDLLCAVPAFRALRAALPRAEIVLIGLPWARALVERFDRYLDGFLELPGYPGLPERPPRPEEIPGFLARVQARRFDLAIQMHGDGSIVNPLAVLLGARLTAGFFRAGSYCPDPGRFIPYPAHEPEVWRHLRLLEHLGIPTRGDELEFPVREADRERLAAVEVARELRPGEYACVHPGASVPKRRWPPERFAAVADALQARGLRVVLTGTAAEADLVAGVIRATVGRPLSLAGRTDLGSLAALLSGARLLVSNDTGVIHLAAALGTPSVVVSTEPSPDRWAPRDRRRHRFLCGGMAVSAATVIVQVDELLLDGGGRGRGRPIVQLPKT